MFRQDLIEKYGASHGLSGDGVPEAELKKALLARNVSFTAVGVVLLAGLGYVFMVAPWILVIAGMVGGSIAVVLGVLCAILWLSYDLPVYLKTIKKAKANGVIEDKE